MEEPEEIVAEDEGAPEEDMVEVEEVTLPEDEKATGIALFKKRKNEIMASLSAACGSFALGTVIGWTSPALPKLKYNDEEQSWIGSIFAIGAVFTTLHTGYLLDHFGRRATILLQIVPFTIGWLLLAFGSDHIAMMFAGRIILGYAGGSMCMAVPVYIGEISSPDVRGSLATLFQFMLTNGVLFVYLFGTFTSVMLLCFGCLIWPWINAITMAFLPESPYFLAKKKRMDAASKAILWLRPDGNPEQEFKEMQESLELKDESILQVLKSKPARKATLVTLTLMFFLQVSGVNVIMYYSESLFEMAGALLSGNSASIVLAIVQCVVTGFSAVIVDKSGRRILLLVSLVGMSVCQFLLAFYFQVLYPERKANWLPLVCLYVYIVFFSIGVGPIPWTMLGEVLPPAAKGSVSSAAVCMSWGMAFVVTKTFHTMIYLGNASTPFWVYGFFCVLGAFLIFLWVPETKGKTLEQIQRELGGIEEN